MLTVTSLAELPPLPPRRTGWPWTQASQPLPPVTPNGSPWPRISIVTPSYNQGQFLEETIRSVLLQSYPNLEYVVIDGGSTDNSPEIIEKYAPWLTYWVSEPDRGQYDAINKGFAKTSGDIMAWINADDKYVGNAFSIIGSVFSQLTEVGWVTSLRPILWDAQGNERWCRRLPGYSRTGFWRGEYVVGVGHFKSAWIQQESTFWRRALWDRTGGCVDDSLDMAGDCELWARFYQHAELYGIVGRLAGFRRHAAQKTATDLQRYIQEAKDIFARHEGQQQSWLRALLRKGIARLPRVARWPWVTVGLAYRGKIIVPDPSNGGWQIVTTVV